MNDVLKAKVPVGSLVGYLMIAKSVKWVVSQIPPALKVTPSFFHYPEAKYTQS